MLRIGLVLHGAGDDADRLGGGVLQGIVVQMSVDGGAVALAVPEQPPARVVSPTPFMTPWEAHVCRQSCRRRPGTRKPVQNVYRRREVSARAGLGIFEPCTGAGSGGRVDLLPTQVEHL